MKSLFWSIIISTLFASLLNAQQGMDDFYKLGPDSLSQDGVPKGEISEPVVLPSQAYPGTQHTYWVYVPKQYDAKVSASLMIFNDGQAFRAIMPVSIAG